MAKKRINRLRNDKGNGSIRVKSNGSFEYRLTYKNEFGEPCRKSFTSTDEDECIEKAEKFLYMLEMKKLGIDPTATVPDIIKQRYRSDLKKNYVGIQGYSRNMETLKIIERSIIGRIPICELTEMQLELFLNSITKYSNSVIGKLYQQTRMAFTIAYDKNLIRKNLMLSRELRCPKSDKPDKKVRAFTDQEQKIFINGLCDHKVPQNRNNYKIQLLIELFSGMRMGEINALKPEDIDFKRKVIHVTSTVSKGYKGKNFIKEGTKTYAGMRDIPMNKMIEPVLKEALENRKYNPLGLVFYDYKKDDIVTTSQVNCFFSRICEKYGLPYYGQHALRHTFATRCIEAGIQPVVLKKWLGHKDIHVTLDTYADVFDSMNDHAIEKLEVYISDLEEKFGEVKKAV